MTPAIHKRLGRELHQALNDCTVLAPLSQRHPEITVADAYAIQQQLMKLRLAAGERVIGKKIGVTSQAVMDMLGVFQPDFGWLTDAMVYNEGEAIPMSRLIQPKAEGEIAFVLRKTLKGPGVTVADVLAATEGVMACFEIVDSRIEDWKIRIQDTVADNASCGVFVIGAQHTDPAGLDLAAVRMRMTRNGEAAGEGLGSAVQGHPAEAVAWLANTLGAFGIPFRAGELILSGSLAPLVPARAGDRFEMEIEGLGSCSIAFS